MRAHEIEIWSRRIIERVISGQLVEDSLVELKSDFINPKNAARIIAAQANAARGLPVLWLIGVDEKRGVTGVHFDTFADWSAQVFSQFDGVTPQMVDIHIDVNGIHILALLFETDRAPFVIKNPDGGKISFEVPWRTATSTRTADRSQLLRILSPLQKAPYFEILDGEMRRSIDIKQVSQQGEDILHEDIFEGERSVSWSVQVLLYIIPESQERIFVPFHYCSASVEVSNHPVTATFNRVSFHTPNSSKGDNIFRPVRATETEIIVEGAGVILLKAEIVSSGVPLDLKRTTARITIDLRLPRTDYSVPVVANFLEVSAIPEPSKLPEPQIRRIVYKESDPSPIPGFDTDLRRRVNRVADISFDPIETHIVTDETLWRYSQNPKNS